MCRHGDALSETGRFEDMAEQAASPPAGARSVPASVQVRFLDPLTAYQSTVQGGVQPTAFVADTLLVRGRHPRTVAVLEEVAEAAGFALRWDSRSDRDDDLLARSGLAPEPLAELEAVWVRRA